MIRKFQESDTTQVMEIWLNGNKDAHSFIPPEYWESHREMVREQLLQAEVYVYKTAGTIQGFIGIQDEHIAGIFCQTGIPLRWHRQTAAGLCQEEARRPDTAGVHKKPARSGRFRCQCFGD